MYKKVEIQEEEGEGETNWESGIDMYPLPCVR